MTTRNRAEGWKYAKLSGHKNEQLVAELTAESKEIQQRILECAHLKDVVINRVEYGGLCETNVDCILGGKTKSKTDMWLHLSNGKKLNVSIKKDDSGQVFLIGIDRFIRGFEMQYGKRVPEQVKRAISLYFGSATDTLDIIKLHSSANQNLQLRKHRLVANTLKSYNETLYNSLIEWINENIVEIFDFCFAKGLAKDSDNWAQILWYKNMVGENQFDTMIYLPDIQSKISPTAVYGIRNGGSTIQLPFGFVQWHSPRKIIPGDIQFHHTYNKILELIK